MNLLIDFTLLIGILAIALTCLISRSLFRSVVFFILLGLMLAIGWIRLGAPDIALAEAAIGAGITGVLLLDTLGHLKKTGNLENDEPAPGRKRLILAIVSSFTLVGLLLWAVFNQPTPAINIHLLVTEAMPESGVSHPVTAVLLNFRSYDTLLEVGVLVLAVLVGLALQTDQQAQDSLPGLPNPLLHACLTLLIPAMLITSMYLLWAGADRPGGAFQAGAMLAAAFILLHISGIKLSSQVSHRMMQAGLLLGFGVFLAVATSSLIGGRPLLAYPEGGAGMLILLIELALTLSIGLILLSLFTIANSPPHHKDQGGDHGH